MKDTTLPLRWRKILPEWLWEGWPGYFQAPLALHELRQRLGLSSNALLLLEVLVAAMSQRQATARVGRRELERRTGLGKKQLEKARQQLQSLGLVRVCTSGKNRCRYDLGQTQARLDELAHAAAASAPPEEIEAPEGAAPLPDNVTPIRRRAQ